MHSRTNLLTVGPLPLKDERMTVVVFEGPSAAIDHRKYTLCHGSNNGDNAWRYFIIIALFLSVVLVSFREQAAIFLGGTSK